MGFAIPRIPQATCPVSVIQAESSPQRPACPLSAHYRNLVRNHTCLGLLGSLYREAFRAAATCVMRAP
jgi:hypothetical protein